MAKEFVIRAVHSNSLGVVFDSFLELVLFDTCIALRSRRFSLEDSDGPTGTSSDWRAGGAARRHQRGFSGLHHRPK